MSYIRELWECLYVGDQEEDRNCVSKDSLCGSLSSPASLQTVFRSLYFRSDVGSLAKEGSFLFLLLLLCSAYSNPCATLLDFGVTYVFWGSMFSSLPQCGLYIDSHLRRKIDLLAGRRGLISVYLSSIPPCVRSQ